MTVHTSKPLMLAIVLLTIASLILTACQAAAPKDLLSTIKARGVMRVSSDPNYKPQSFINDKGEMDGFDIDVSKEVAKRLGVSLDDLLVSQPDSGEEALTICETLARSNALDVIVIDSVAALVPKAELEGEMGMATMGMQARLMSQALRKLAALLAKSKTTCIFTNQLREKVGIMFGNPETTPGGKALKFYASVRIDIRRKDTLKDAAGNAIGNHVRVKIVKNKVAPPFGEAEFDILYNHGINQEGSILDVGIESGAVEKKGAWLQFEGELIGQGKDAAQKALAEQPELAQKIVNAIMARRNAAAPG
jgi:recombination protein RecA